MRSFFTPSYLAICHKSKIANFGQFWQILAKFPFWRVLGKLCGMAIY
jgi:hypothetical protein